jgi:signal transduction histidine kinase
MGAAAGATPALAVNKVAPGTASASSAPPARADAYTTERRRQVLARVVATARLAFVPIGLAAAANVAVLRGPQLASHLATLLVQAGLCVAALALGRGRHAERRATGLAMALAIGMATSLFWSLSLAPKDLDVLVGAIACLLMASPLAFPWGVRPQIVVSVYTVAGYLLVPPWPAVSPARALNVALGLGLGLGTSVLGAWTLDRQRRATFVERERVSALAAEAELLVAIGRELNATLDLPALVHGITGHGRVIVAADAAALMLIDARAGVIRTVAIAPRTAPLAGDETTLEFPLDAVEPFLVELRGRSGPVQLPDGSPLDAVQAVNRSFGYERTLYVPIVRDDRLLGVLGFLQHRADPPFTAHQARMAEGLAHQAAVALDNARLVADLQHASRVKSEFVSTMSHELRTPLHVIIGYTDMLDELPGEERARAVERIRHASRELLDLVQATLDLNRLESPDDAPVFGQVPVHELWAQLESEFAALPRTGDALLRWQPVNGAVIETDRRKLKIVLKNLVGNALKFTPRGEVSVGCHDDGRVCRFVVRDTGVGIAAEDVSVIFEMFRQVDSSDSRSFGGAGLGLYIVRRLVTQLGGTVDVASAPGVGSTFTVTLPQAPPAPPAAAA